jgi:hypothetical protein
MRRRIAILVALVIAGLAAAGVFFLTHGRASVTAATPPPAPPAVPVVAGTVASGEYRDDFDCGCRRRRSATTRM